MLFGPHKSGSGWLGSSRKSEVCDEEPSLDELEKLKKEFESFAYSISHDFRAPIRHIQGFAELLSKRRDKLDDKGREYLDLIIESAGELSLQLDSLLLYSRIGRAELNEEEVSIKDLVHAIRQELKDQTAGRIIRWKVLDLPTVRGDRNLLKIVVTNLLTNAVKATGQVPEAEIEVGTVASDEEKIIYVRDNGIGFDPHYANKLFQNFQKLHSVQEFKGIGMGLSIARRILERHGGRIWAEGESDHGATFFAAFLK
jgi:two-component system, chemotaxis family, sensor kinase Cph1